MKPQMSLSIDFFRLVSKLFTRPVIAELARTGSFKSAFSYDLGADFALNRVGFPRLADLFEYASDLLKANYRSEYVYKNELTNRLIFGRHSPRTAGIQIEMPIGRSIVDVAVANGTSTAYEIKTAYDSTRRLQSQTTDYLCVFDKVYVVTHASMAESIRFELDERVGVLVLTQKGSIQVHKEAKSNRANIRPSDIFNCLRRAEYIAAIEPLVGSVPELPNGIISDYCENIFTRLSPEEAHAAFVQALRNRTTDPATVDFVSKLPNSLRSLGFATPLSRLLNCTQI